MCASGSIVFASSPEATTISSGADARGVGWVAVVVVDGDREDARVRVEGLLGAVSVVDVPVDDGDPGETPGLPGVHDADRGVPEDAEPPPERGLGGVRRASGVPA